ncbi:MAG: MaoC family dehydratase, partial [Burkholderiales bacterium]
AAVGARFAAHREDAGVLVEQAGFFFEDAAAGETFVHYPSRSFFRAEATEHAWRSMDLSPQFHDTAWIDAHQDGRYRIPETFVLGAVTALTTRTFGRVVANLGWYDIVLADVHAGDTVTAASTIIEKRDSKSRPNEGILTVDTRATNQHGDVVCSYRRNLLVYRRDAQTPYAQAGY